MEKRELTPKENADFLAVQANLQVKGYAAMQDDGILILPAGKEKAREEWMKLDPELRLLFGWLIRASINRPQDTMTGGE